MYLSEQQILAFQKILEADFHEDVSYDEASELAYGFFELGLALYELDAKLYRSNLDENGSEA